MPENPCHKLAPLISAYIDNELTLKEVRELEEHLCRCQNCHGNLESEKEIKRLIQQKVRVEKAPDYLQYRIRRLLTRTGQPPAFWEIIRSLFQYRPAATSFALAVLGVLIIFPIYQIVNSEQPKLLQEVRVDGGMTGQVLCLDCVFHEHDGDMSHAPGTYRAGLRCDDGRLWTFLQSSRRKELIRDKKYLMQRVVVKGTVFKEAQYVSVEDYTIL